MSEKENKIHNVGDKFKLKKDLPTWKAGEEMWIGEDGCLYGTTKDGDVIMVYHVSTLLNFKILNSEWFEKVEKEKSIFNLKDGDKIYYINEVGYINNYFYISNISDYIENGNAFLTKEEAEAELEKRKAIQRVKKYCWENNIKLLSDKELKEILEYNVDKHYLNIINFYYIYYKIRDKEFDSSFSNILKSREYFYFEKEEGVKKVIKNCEEDLKIIFNV